VPRRRILAATDGTLQGEHAVGVAQAFAQAADADFQGLGIAAEEPDPDRKPAWAEGTESGYSTVLTNRGLPGVEIVRRAELMGAYLVVLGRNERVPGGPRPVDATTDAVIRRRNGLSLLVPPSVQTIRRSIIALDGSLRGSGVAAPAVAFLKLLKAQAHALCVLPGVPFEVSDAGGWRDPRAEWLSEVIHRLPSLTPPVDLRVRWGNPVTEILDAVRDTGSDLLILGVRRGGQRGDSGSGYVGRELLRSASCAVLTVPI
jgi:nucleotide-binding universal stress UspA family protein